MKNSARLAAAVIGSLVIIAAAASHGSSGIGIGDTVRILGHKCFGLGLPHDIDPKTVSIVWLLRLPRVLLAFIAGGSLAASGAVTQSVLRNPLASPYILGVSSGASLGAGLIIISGISLPLAGAFTLPLAGFAFGLATVFAVIAFSALLDKSMSNNTVILCGMIFSLFVGAVLTTLSAVFSDALKRITLWQMGSFAMRGWLYVKLILPFFVLGFAGVMCYTREMDMLTFGEEQAKSAGVATEAVRKKLLAFAVVLSGAAVALSGVIGFVDLIAPHAARKIIGSRHRYAVPMAFLLGGSLMAVTDLIARTVISPSELPVGAITALIGAPFFVWVYFRRRKAQAG
ncbi:MAG: iron ABC transporter permease [Spirochaetaceae bacterium]|jgi:iron complex transport system permease protein|nr:iron ABC transporter permease [Spirochaetaceae bacterium]